MKTHHVLLAVAAACILIVAPFSAAQQAPHQGEGQRVERHVELPTKGVAVLVPSKDSEVHGTILFDEREGALRITGRVVGLTPGLHGFHVHEFGDLRDPQGESAGDHFNPTEEKHGAPGEQPHHAGDLGNIEANEEGVAEVQIEAPWLPLHFIVGRSIVVHADPDDLESQPSGDAGARVAVGVIGIARPDTRSVTSQ